MRSKVRRRMIALLWGERASGSVAELAERAHVSFASAYRELKAMSQAGLASSTRVGEAEVFAANEGSPCADAMRSLALAPATAERDDGERDDHVRNALFTLGAPTFGRVVAVEDTELALVQGVQLSHRDGTVASVLPICFYRQRDRVSPVRLALLARQLGEKRALGFYLDLTAELTGDARFGAWAARLRDKRCRGVAYLFVDDSRSALSRQIAERNTPEVARRWNLRANTRFETFQATFEKHIGE